MAGPRWWGEVGEVKPGLDDPVRELCSGEATEELTHLPMRNHIWTQGRGGGGRVCLLIRPSPHLHQVLFLLAGRVLAQVNS